MSYYGRSRSSWPRYVPVAERRAQASTAAKKILKNGQETNPVTIQGRTIAATFWGKAWCQNLESYSDFANRLPRGRTYVRNGSVIDLQIKPGVVQALVIGSSLYKVKISIIPMAIEKWKILVKNCLGKIDSIVELLQGKFSKAVMGTMTEANQGLFPKSSEIKFTCSCPDWAGMCKHVAAVMYGIGARLDNNPELLFTLRQVDYLDLVTKTDFVDSLNNSISSSSAIADEDLSAIFGIDMAVEPAISKNNLPKPVTKTKTKVKSVKVLAKKSNIAKETTNIKKVVSKSVIKQKTKKSKLGLK